MNNLKLLKIWCVVAGTYALYLGLLALSLIDTNTTSEQGGYIALALSVTSFLSVSSFVAIFHVDEWL